MGYEIFLIFIDVIKLVIFTRWTWIRIPLSNWWASFSKLQAMQTEASKWRTLTYYHREHYTITEREKFFGQQPQASTCLPESCCSWAPQTVHRKITHLRKRDPIHNYQKHSAGFWVTIAILIPDALPNPAEGDLNPAAAQSIPVTTFTIALKELQTAASLIVPKLVGGTGWRTPGPVTFYLCAYPEQSWKFPFHSNYVFKMASSPCSTTGAIVPCTSALW